MPILVNRTTNINIMKPVLLLEFVGRFGAKSVVLLVSLIHLGTKPVLLFGVLHSDLLNLQIM